MAERQNDMPKYPRNIGFIIVSEFCERFSFYGNKAILVLYFTSRLHLNDDSATGYYHFFTMLVYFTPLFGAIIADSFLGKFKTILYISMVLAAGNIVLAVTSIPMTNSSSWGALVGLLLIAIGAGGIKPCVSAFGGDQFIKGQEKYLDFFFSMFYFSINVGALLSTIITPLLKGEINCFGEKCYLLAFGLPAILMILALALFVIGKFTVGYQINPPEGNMLAKTVICIVYAIKNRCRGKQPNRSHWLDYASDKYDAILIKDVKILLAVAYMLLPLPIFWALYDQQGSRWTLQALRMDLQVGNFTIRPDMVNFVNSLLVLMFIPIFQGIIYPLFAKFKKPTRLLQRMTAGMVFAAAAFIVSMFIQLKINNTLPPIPAEGKSNLFLINMAPCSATIETSSGNKIETFILNRAESKSNLEVERYMFNISVKCLNELSFMESIQQSFQENLQFTTLLISASDNALKLTQLTDPSDSLQDVNSLINMVNLLPSVEVGTVGSLKMSSNSNLMTLSLNGSIESGFLPQTIGNYVIKLEYYDQDGNAVKSEPIPQMFEAKNGAATYLIFENETKSKNIIFREFEYTPANSVSVFLQIPQYILLSIAEVLFSISGLEFAYKESPSSMKSVMQSFWCLTIAFGNLLVFIVAEVKYISNQAYEFLLFGLLMLLDTLIFGVMAHFYKSIKNSTLEEKTDGSNQQNALEIEDERL